MGPAYLFFRIRYALQLRLGLLQKKFPASPKPIEYISLKKWQNKRPAFFFPNQKDPKPTIYTAKRACKIVHEARQGNWLFFSSALYKVGMPPDWLLNPDNHFRYNTSKHWTQIPDFSPRIGDIKFVWELSRFSWLGDFIRCDAHTNQDLGETVLSLMEHWMQSNPLNMGPHYRCSQEIALRTMNWTCALYYYAEHPALTEKRFNQIMHYLYWQFEHIEKNLSFSRIAVRNNHLMTEALALYTAGLLFPFLPRAHIWKKLGKENFEREIRFQIAEDGSYLQHSHNYHRLVVQLLCWYLSLTKLHTPGGLSKLTPDLRKRMEKTLHFLLTFQNEKNGHLPQYGANDGSLFFRLSETDYADFRPQLHTLQLLLYGYSNYPKGSWCEEAYWFGVQSLSANAKQTNKYGTFKFTQGGLYVLKEHNSTTIVRCAHFKHRPAQADNLHLDIWLEGKNIFRDAGSYRYNTHPKWIHYFNGTSAHNTVSLGDENQMLKGPRFIWYYWSKALQATWQEKKNCWIFEGEIKAFAHIASGIRHYRRVIKIKNQNKWIIEDELYHHTKLPMRQHWHPFQWPLPPGWKIEAKDKNEKTLPLIETEGWYAASYPDKQNSPAFYFETKEKYIKTTIQYQDNS